MGTSDACYTFEAALEMAIAMEEEGFRHYLEGLRIVMDRNAREMLQEMAMDELEHKHSLEKALVQGSLDGAHALGRPVPTMDLDYVLKNESLKKNSGVREVLAYAIHLEKQALDFYRRMAQGCAGAPMSGIFERIGHDEARHLQMLEDMYEEHFLAEN